MKCQMPVKACLLSAAFVLKYLWEEKGCQEITGGGEGHDGSCALVSFTSEEMFLHVHRGRALNLQQRSMFVSRRSFFFEQGTL